MIKKSYINISFVSAGNIINTILGFLFLVALARTLSIEDMGKYAILSGMLTFIAKGTDFGTNSLFVAKSITDESKNLLNTFYSVKIVSLFLLVPISLIVLFLLNLLNYYIVTVFLIGLIAYTINFTIYGLFQKHENYLYLILVNSIIAISKAIFAVLILLNIFVPNLNQAFSIFSLSVIPSLFLILFIPKEYLYFELKIKDALNFLKKSFYAGFSLMINQGWSAIAATINSVLKNYSSAGIYYIADKISTIFSLVSLSIFTVLLPKNAKRKKQNQDFDFKETFLISISLIILAFIGTVISKYIVIPIFGQSYQSSLSILYILLFASSFNAISTFMENYFFVEGITNRLLPITLVKLITFVSISYFFIPFYSIYAVAYASLISSISTVLLTAFYIYKNNNNTN